MGMMHKMSLVPAPENYVQPLVNSLFYLDATSRRVSRYDSLLEL